MDINDIIKSIQNKKKKSQWSVFQGVIYIGLIFLLAKFAGGLNSAEKEFINKDIMPIVFYIVGIVFFLVFFYQAYKQFIACFWIKTTCTIEDKRFYKDEKSAVMGSSFVPLIYVLPIVLFRYNYKNKFYSSYKIFNGISLTILSNYAEELFQDYDNAKSYSCYVNPRKPEEAVLSNEIYFRYIVPHAILGTIFMIITYYM